MTETLTESFCERCGTRYEFSAPTRLNPLRKTRGLIGGLKNWVTSQDDFSDSINDAMRDEEGALATAQLSAFHEAFNFCIDCRQYTCLSCWNEDAGRCRTCVPIAGQDDLAARIAEATTEELGRHVGAEAWPTHDLPVEAAPATNGHVADDEWATTPGTWATAAPAVPEAGAAAPGGGFVGVDGFVYETQEQADKVAAQLERQRQSEAEAALAAMAAAEAAAAEAAAVEEPERVAAEVEEPEPVAAEVEEPEPVIAEVEPQQPALRVVAWDEDSAEGLEPEPIFAEAEDQAVVAAEPPIGTTAPMWPDAIADEEPAAAEVEPEPIAAAEAEPEGPVVRPIAPISETIVHLPQRPAVPEPQPEPQPLAAQDDSPEAVARRAQLDMLGLGDPGEGPMQADRQVIPYRSRGAAVTPAELAMRAAAGQRFWEASAREVASAVGNVGVQNCGDCGLSLSANARFCRRCGTRQAQSA